MSETQGSSNIVAGTETADDPLGRSLLRRYATSPGLVSREVPSRAGMMAAGFSIDRTQFLTSVLRRWAGVQGPTADWATLVDRWPYFSRERNPLESSITSTTRRSIPTISPTVSRKLARRTQEIQGRMDGRSPSPLGSAESPAGDYEGSAKSATTQGETTVVKSSANDASTTAEFALATDTLNDRSGAGAIAAAPIKAAVTVQARPIIRRQPRQVASETMSVGAGSTPGAGSDGVSERGANGASADGRSATSGQLPAAAPAQLNQQEIARPKVIHRTVEMGKTSSRQISTSIANPSRAISEASPNRTSELPPVGSTTAHPDVAPEAPATSNSVAHSVKPDAGHHGASDGGPEPKNVKAADPLPSTSSISGIQAGQHTQDSRQTASLAGGSNPLPAIQLRRNATSSSLQGRGDNAPISTRATELSSHKSSASASTSDAAISQHLSTSASSISGTQTGRHTLDIRSTLSLNPGSTPLPAIHLRRSASSFLQGGVDNAAIPTAAADLAGYKSSAGTKPNETATSATSASNSPVAAPVESIATKLGRLPDAPLPAASIDLSNAGAASRPEEIALTHPQQPLRRSPVSTASDSSVEPITNHNLSTYSSAKSDVPELAERILRRYSNPSSQAPRANLRRSLKPELQAVNPNPGNSAAGQQPMRSLNGGIQVISLPHAESTTPRPPISLVEPAVMRSPSEKDASFQAPRYSNEVTHAARSHELLTVNGNDTHVASPTTDVSRGHLISRTSRSFPEPFKPTVFPYSVTVPNVDARPSPLRSSSPLATRNANRLPGLLPTLPPVPTSPKLSSAPLSLKLSGMAGQTASPQLVLHAAGASARVMARAAAVNAQVWRSPLSKTSSNIYRDSSQLSHRVLRSAAVATSSTVQPPNAATGAAGMPSPLPSINSISGAVPDKGLSSKVNLPQLAEQVYRLLARRLANERERRGG